MNEYLVNAELTNVINLPLNESMEVEVHVNENLLHKTNNPLPHIRRNRYTIFPLLEPSC